MRTIVISSILAIVAGPLRGEVVTERWGTSARCRHSGAAVYLPVADGVAVQFDLSSVPKGARIHRARFLPHIRTDGIPLAEPLVVQPLSAPVAGKSEPSVVGQPMLLVGPRYVSLDATAVVRGWVAGTQANHGLLVRGPRIDRERTCLEITYEGALNDPPPAVTGLRAFYRAGQVFLTWKEVLNPLDGKAEVQWKDLKADLDRIRDGRGPVVSYRVYRHTRPITRQTIGDAQLLDEIGQHAGFDEREIKMEWKGEQIKNVRLDEARVPRTAVEEEAELPVGTGVFVTTCRTGGAFYYAVVAAVNGVENTVALDRGNTAGPLDEKVARSEPILFRKQKLMYEPRAQDCYVWWLDEPLAHLPTFIHLSLSPPAKETPEPRALAVYNWWWGSGWNTAAQYPFPECVGLVIDQNCMQTRGIHDGCGTYKAWSQGKVQGYFVRQFRALLPWMKAQYRIDKERMFAISSGWAWHYPDLFAAAFEVDDDEPEAEPGRRRVETLLGRPEEPCADRMGRQRLGVLERGRVDQGEPGRRIAVADLRARMHTGDFGILDKPPLFRALLDTKRCWSGVTHEGSNIGHRAPEWMFQIRRSDSLAAFGNSTLDDNPGIGFGGDPECQLNGYLCFEPRTQVDRPDLWEMTVYLASGDKTGRNGAPLDECMADVTPRRCRQFKAQPGQRFAWTNTSLAGDKTIQSGTAVADDRGLVTAQQVCISKGKNRLAIRRE